MMHRPGLTSTFRAALLLAGLLPGVIEAGAIQTTAPAGFIRNEGQLDSRVLFYANGPKAAVYLMSDGMTIDLREDGPGQLRDRVRGPAAGPEVTREIHRKGRCLRLGFIGAGRSGPTAEGPTGASYNFLFGNDPARWNLDVPSYCSVVYRNLWPGIDLACSLEDGRFSCDLETAAGTDPAGARFSLDGAGKDGRDLTWSDLAAIGALEGIPGIGASRNGPTDPGPARDDPSRLLWSTFLGGTGEEIAWSVVLDSNRDPVVTGITFSTHFPTTHGAYDTTYAGGGDVFVSKLDASGHSLLWSTFLGGTGSAFDYGYGVTLNPAGDPIVTGYTGSSNFPVTTGAYDVTFNGAVDVFVTELDSQGGHLNWSTFLGGNDNDIGYAVALDSQGDPVVAGRTLSANFPVTPGAYDTYPDGEEDAFVSKLSADGRSLLWSTYVGGSALDEATAIKLDNQDDPIITGYTASSNYPGANYAGGLYDVIATKLNPAGSALLWSRTLGGSSYEFGNGLALDAAQNLLICGATDSPDFPVTPGAYDGSYNGGDDAFVARLSGSGGAILWATYLGGTTPGYETAFGIGVDSSDRPVIAGSTPSADFPVTPDAYDTSYNGGSDVFVSRFDAGGSTLQWSTFLGGGGDDYAYDLALDPEGQAVVTGAAGPGFPTTLGAFDPTYNGDVSDVFVAKLQVEVNPNAVEAPPAATGRYALRLEPNVVAGAARVEFALPSASNVRIDLVDAAGRLRAVLAEGSYTSGEHGFLWNGRTAKRLSSGRYFIRISAGGRGESVPLTIIR